jgi:hypothetical protein
MDDLEFDQLLDQEIGPEVSSDIPKQVSVADGIPGKSSQNVVSWVEIATHSAEDAEILVGKLKTASINYPDLKIKQLGKSVIAQVSPITIEIPYLNGVIKVASEHGVSNINKKFQVVDAK